MRRINISLMGLIIIKPLQAPIMVYAVIVRLFIQKYLYMKNTCM